MKVAVVGLSRLSTGGVRHPATPTLHTQVTALAKWAAVIPGQAYYLAFIHLNDKSPKRHSKFRGSNSLAPSTPIRALPAHFSSDVHGVVLEIVQPRRIERILHFQQSEFIDFGVKHQVALVIDDNTQRCRHSVKLPIRCTGQTAGKICFNKFQRDVLPAGGWGDCWAGSWSAC